MTKDNFLKNRIRLSQCEIDQLIESSFNSRKNDLDDEGIKWDVPINPWAQDEYIKG